MSFEYEKYTHLYTSTLQAIQDGYPLIVHEGGTSSSKTYSIMQAAFPLAISDPGCVITVVGQDIPNLKKGAMRDASNILMSEPRLKDEFKPLQKTDRIYEHKESGSIIEFNSYDDEQDAKNGKRDYSFFNEANGIPYPIFEAVYVRTAKATIIDHNPTAPYWAHEKILPDKENRKWFVSNFRHNPFIEDKVRQKILSYEPTEENIARGTANQYRWQVYGLGQMGRLEGLVFPDFQVTTDWPVQYKWRIFGLDFGFTNDPTAFIEIRYAHGGLYWKQHIYETGLTNPDICNRLDGIGHNRSELVVADSAEPKSIEEIKRRGFNIVGAEKGKDSINQGIDAIKRYPLFIHATSKNLTEEFSSYTWKEDKDGNSTNQPIDAFNHGIDAGRYALSKKILKERKTLSPQVINV